MARKSQAQKILDRLKEATGIEIELPVETEQDRMLEAQSVLNYFTINDGKWKTVKCATCNNMFAYRYHIDGVKHCSVDCMREALKKIGLEWHPEREPSRRWGRYAPAILPPSVLEIVQQDQNGTLEDPLDSIDPELLR